MVRKLGRRSFAVLAGTMVVAGPVAAACSQGATFDEWAATDGAAGRINMDEVQEAFKKSKSPTEFERKVNEIYEGDGLILIRSSDDGETKLLEGFEDLNGSGTIDETADDLLFSFVRKGQENELIGHGANGYYRRPFGGGDLLFTYLIISSFSGPRGGYYSTPRSRAGTIRANRTSYRGSSGYRTQVSKNSRYFSRRGGFTSSQYNSAGRNLSQGRSSYLATNRTSGAFKNSTTGVRSRWGSSSATRRSGGFRGGGGAQVVVGFKRGRAR